MFKRQCQYSAVFGRLESQCVWIATIRHHTAFVYLSGIVVPLICHGLQLSSRAQTVSGTRLQWTFLYALHTLQGDTYMLPLSLNSMWTTPLPRQHTRILLMHLSLLQWCCLSNRLCSYYFLWGVLFHTSDRDTTIILSSHHDCSKLSE